MIQTFEVRKATTEDIMSIYGRMVVESWNPGVYDQMAYATSDSIHMFVGVLDGKVVSSCCACVYQKEFAFFGCYLVFEPELRGKGYGLATYRHRLSFIDKLGVKSVGCDGVLDQTHNYAKNGFVDNYLNRRFCYMVKGTEAIPANVLIEKIPASNVANFEAKFVYESRLGFIEPWLKNDPTMKYAMIQNTDKQILALGIARQAQTGFRIGPIYADTLYHAKQITTALASQLPEGTELLIDIPEANCHADHFIKELELENCNFECMRMYRGTPPDISLDQVYGMCMLEVG